MEIYPQMPNINTRNALITRALDFQSYRKFLLTLLIFTFSLQYNYGQKLIQRIDPPFWFDKIEVDTLQLILYGNNIRSAKLLKVNAKAKMVEVNRTLDAHHLILNFKIDTAVKENLIFDLKLNRTSETIEYAIKPLIKSNLKINSSDVMYMVFPDRFSNGNTQNDSLPGLFEGVDRSIPKARHGGDIAGIANHIDYFKTMGVSSVWINPLIENNQPKYSYHGYAATDLYNIDARFGSNEDYKNLSEQFATNNIKLVMDVVYNHIGNEHPFYKNRICDDWFNMHDTFLQSNYRTAALIDPYATNSDKYKLSTGWFDTHMPDLNQRNPLVARYLIQNTLWWIAYAKLTGVRIDTYPYPDMNFMKNLVASVKLNFPNVFVFGETWEHGVAFQSAFAQNNFGNPIHSKLDGATDFQLYFAINKAFNEPFGWTEGLSRLYYTEAADHLYKNPNNLVTFADNHDLDRIFGILGNDLNKMKMAMGYLLTTRGIPCLYYGTELLMNDKGDHGLLRKDFPGGWQNDSINNFNVTNKTQFEIFNFIKTLNTYRTANSAIFNDGKRLHFVPENGTYVYTIATTEKTLLVVLNQNTTNTTLNLARFAEVLKGKTQAMDVLTKNNITFSNSLNLAPQSILVLEL